MINKITDLLAAQLPELSREEISQMIEIPPKADMGDYAFPCFKLAKLYRKAPSLIANDLLERVCGMFFERKVHPGMRQQEIFGRTEQSHLRIKTVRGTAGSDGVKDKH